MNEQLQEEIISKVKKQVEEVGYCSIKQAASSSFAEDISMADQRSLAKKIVKGHSFITETKEGEIIVRQNLNYSGDNGNADIDYKFLKAILVIVVAILSYLVFEVFLPRLK